MLRFSGTRIPDQQEEDYRERSDCQPNKKEIVPGEQAERGAGIRSVYQAEKPRNDRVFSPVWDVLTDEPLCELVEREERQSKKDQVFHSSMASSLTTSAHRSHSVGYWGSMPTVGR